MSLDENDKAFIMETVERVLSAQREYLDGAIGRLMRNIHESHRDILDIKSDLSAVEGAIGGVREDLRNYNRLRLRNDAQIDNLNHDSTQKAAQIESLERRLSELKRG